MDWRSNILTTDDKVRELLGETKTDRRYWASSQSHTRASRLTYVPIIYAEAGYEIIPVPVYYPDVTEIMGKPVLSELK
jgi:hypothetical protein